MEAGAPAHVYAKQGLLPTIVCLDTWTQRTPTNPTQPLPGVEVDVGDGVSWRIPF